MIHPKLIKPACRSIIVVVFAGLLLPSVAARGDEPRHHIHFTSENGRFVLLNVHRSIERVPIFEENRFMGVMDRKREEDIWGLFDAQSAKALGSDREAQVLKASHTPVYKLRGEFRTKTALVSDDGNLVVVIDDFSEQEPRPDLEVLHFYNAGKLVAAYTLDDLLINIEGVRYTASHFVWFFSRSLRFDQGTLFLTTTECVPVTFSTTDGAFVSTKRETGADSPRVGECD
jgi:hypothetical protein